jgi:subtilisin-like proprotein convertase family protein
VRKASRFSSVLPVLVALWLGPLAGQSAAQTFTATPATLGAIPDGVGEGVDGPPLVVAVPVTGVVGGVTTVSVSMVLTHTWMGEIVATLIAPDGSAHVLFGRTRADVEPFWGTDNDLLNTAVTFTDAAAGNWWAAAGQNPVPAGSYRTSAVGGFLGATGPVTTMNPAFTNREPNGTWYVRFTDSHRQDIGTVSALSLTLGSTGVATPPIAAVADAYFAGLNTPLVIAAPGVLGNDLNSPGSGALVASVQTLPIHGTLTLNSDGGFRYTPVAGYLGPDVFTYVPSNVAGPAPAAATVSLTVVPVQPPVNFRVDRVSGSLVTLRWDAPPYGPVPTGYSLEGGTTPGSVLAAVVTGRAAALTFSAPTGSFYVRAKALDGAMTSGVSNEVSLHVNVPVTPSAPLTLTGLVNADALALTWKLSYAGGEPTDVVLDVSGAAAGSVPVGPTESFVFTGVPAGTYTFSVRARNAGGLSSSSAPVTLTFPGSCSGVPLPPRNYLFYSVGNVLYLLWDPPASGPAASTYVLNVTGAFVGAIPVGSSRNLSGAVPSGFYGVSVTAVNACGAGAPTAVQTVQVP